MKYKKYLVLDVGADSSRLISARFNSKKIEIEELNRSANVPVQVSGTLYWDILKIYSDIKNGLQKATRNEEYTSLAIDTWAVDFAFIDKNKRIISNPVHYRDKERNSSKVYQELFSKISRRDIFLNTGSIFSVSSIFNLIYLKLINATEFLKAYKFLMIPDLLNYFLTGQIFNEYSNATSTGFYNIKNKTWSSEILGKIGVSEKIFAKIVYPTMIIGEITGSVCEELSVKPIKVVAPAAWDNSSAVAGTPCIKNNTVNSFCSLGTWATISVETEEPIVNDKVYKSGFINAGGMDYKNILLKTLTGLWIVQTCREKWIKDSNAEISWAEIDKMYSKKENFKSFINIEDPIFSACYPDMPKVISDYCRKTYQDIPYDIGEFCRCIYESMAMMYRSNISILNKLINKKIETINLVGGGIKNKTLCQWIANATNTVVYAGPTESTSFGNVISQLVATKEIKDLKEGRELIFNSVDIVVYEPEDTDIWEETYQNKYLKKIVQIN